MVPFPGFCGQSYELTNRQAAVQRSNNWYPAPIESQDETKGRWTLEPSPGNKQFTALPVPAPFNQPARGLIEYRGTVVGVNGNKVFRLNPDATYTLVGTMLSANGNTPVSMTVNGNGQVFIACNDGTGYVVPIGAPPNSLVQMRSEGFLGSVFCTMQDNYIIVVSPNSQQYQISGDDDNPIGDATKWDAANILQLKGQADLLRACISRREYLRLLGDRRSQIHVDIGSNGIGGFPFQIYNQTYVECGIAAPFSLVSLNGDHMWIAQDENGPRYAVIDRSFNPERVSTFAVEQAWSKYVRIDDAVAFAYNMNGHLFYQVTFPHAIANNPVSGFPLPPPPSTTYTAATWVYDYTVSQLLGRPMWHQRTYQNGSGFQVGRAERFHCQAFGKHLVSSIGTDGNPGAVYEYSPTTFTDCGVDIDGTTQVLQSIVRDRVACHTWQNNHRLVVSRIEFELAKGQGLDGDPTAPGANPQMLVRWSKDGGNTYAPSTSVSMGRQGEYGKLCYINRTVTGRDLVLWVQCSDPTYPSLISANMEISELGS